MTTKGYLDQPDLHIKAPFRAAVLTYPGNFRQALRQAQDDASKTLFGVGHGIPSTFVTKVLASTGPDFIWIDVEHAMFDRRLLNDAIQAAQSHSEGKAMVIVRIPKKDAVTLTTALDAGAAGVVIPHCESAQEVEELVKEVYFPPIGCRSYSPWTCTPGIPDPSLYHDDALNMKTSNCHIGVIAQVESVQGMRNVDEIAAVQGVCALMFGPGDYARDAGLPPLQAGSEPHPTLATAMAEFAAAGQKHNKPLFGIAMGPEMIPTMIHQGYRAIVAVIDMWGLGNVVYDSLKQGRALARQVSCDDKSNQL